MSSVARIRGWLRPRRLAFVVMLVIVCVLVRVAFDARADEQQPRLFPDSYTYLETANQPVSIDHFFHPKPFLVPAVYRVVGTGEESIVRFQRELAFWSFLLLGLVCIACLETWTGRLLGFGVAAMFLLTPLRTGWTGVVLAESINDSLVPLMLSAVIASIRAKTLTNNHARAWLTTTLAVTAAVIAVAWVLARDTNAIAVIVIIMGGRSCCTQGDCVDSQGQRLSPQSRCWRAFSCSGRCGCSHQPG